ncbi:MAG: glycosyltransferase family A protein [Cyclobacteriaceae bacterium]
MREGRSERRDPLVSIIIPVYNKAAYIRETLDSAMGQTYSHTEIILIDDGSTDGSFEILNEYLKKYPNKINLLDQENKGVSVATNVGIQAAKGEYIQFLDADDLMSSDKIERQIQLLSEKSQDIIASCEWVNFKDSIHEINKVPYGIFKDFDSGIDWLLRAWNHQEMMADSSWMTHRSLIEKAGPWNESLTINQDGEFFCRVLSHCNGVLFDPGSVIYYRTLHEGNVSQQKTEKAWYSLLESYRCYECRILQVEDSKRIRIALKKVYQKFIYDVFPEYPDLIKEAEVCIKNLGIPQKTAIGGPKFQMLSKLFGFKNALRLKRWLA